MTRREHTPKLLGSRFPVCPRETDIWVPFATRSRGFASIASR
jgi:hypothetical protein